MWASRMDGASLSHDSGTVRVELRAGTVPVTVALLSSRWYPKVPLAVPYNGRRD